jgi:hypothetical protein
MGAADEIRGVSPNPTAPQRPWKKEREREREEEGRERGGQSVKVSAGYLTDPFDGHHFCWYPCWAVFFDLTFDFFYFSIYHFYFKKINSYIYIYTNRKRIRLVFIIYDYKWWLYFMLIIHFIFKNI